MSDGSGFYDGEKEWLRKERRLAAWRTALLMGVLVLGAVLLAWVIGRPPGGGGRATATTTVDQRAIADAQKALADWGQFAVSNDLRDVRDSFWANGPQYKQLAKEARERRGKKLGPPPYKMTLTGVQVIAPRPNQRVLRGRVEMTRPGEKPQSFRWDIWLQQDRAADGRWRLWTVRNTAAS